MSLRCAKPAVDESVVLSILSVNIGSEKLVFVVDLPIFDCESMQQAFTGDFVDSD